MKIIFKYFIFQALGNGLLFSLFMLCSNYWQNGVVNIDEVIFNFIGFGLIMGLFWTIPLKINLNQIGVNPINKRTLQDAIIIKLQSRQSLEEIEQILNNSKLMRKSKIINSGQFLQIFKLSLFGKLIDEIKIKEIDNSNEFITYQIGKESNKLLWLEDYVSINKRINIVQNILTTQNNAYVASLGQNRFQ